MTYAELGDTTFVDSDVSNDLCIIRLFEGSPASLEVTQVIIVKR